MPPLRGPDTMSPAHAVIFLICHVVMSLQGGWGNSGSDSSAVRWNSHGDGNAVQLCCPQRRLHVAPEPLKRGRGDPGTGLWLHLILVNLNSRGNSHLGLMVTIRDSTDLANTKAR